MEAGVALDSLIARKVWRAIVVNDAVSGESYMVAQATGGKVPVPAFSTDLKEANRVVEFYQTQGWFFRVKSIPEEDGFHGCFYKEDGRAYVFHRAPTIPLVICTAALALVNGMNIAGG